MSVLRAFLPPKSPKMSAARLGGGRHGPFYQKAHLEGGAKIRWRRNMCMLVIAHHTMDGL